MSLSLGIAALQRDVAMFLAGIGVAFVFKGTERSDDPRAGIGGFDDCVDVATLGGDKWVGETVAEFGDFFLAQFFALRFGNFCQLPFVNNVYRAFWAHDGNLRR